MSHLGFSPILTAAPATGPAAPFVAAAGLALTAFPFLVNQIGQGSAEADTIVPFQNQAGNTLADISARARISTNIQELQGYYADLIEIAREFDAFTRDPQFTDGRASEQARETILPLIDQMLTDISEQIYALGGSLPQITPTAGYGQSITTLQYPMQTFPFLPQAGFLPPTAPLSPIQPRVIPTITAGIGEYLPYLLAGGLLLYAIQRR